MKLLFIDFSCNVFDKHHVYSLASFLAGHGMDVRYAAEAGFTSALATVTEERPDLLLYSAFSSDITLYEKFDRLVKERFPARSIMGGAGPTFDWSLAGCSTIDAICIGEGERALLEFVESGFTGGGNIIMNGGERPERLLPFVDLNSIPVPDRSLVYARDRLLREMPSKQFLSGRGCPYRCTYCYNSIFNETFKGCGPIIRKKSIDYLFEEIRRVQRQFPLKSVVFHDDTFIADRTWFYEFAERYPAEIGLPYSCCVRADLLNEDIVRALFESGCASANWSIECANDHLRNEVLKRRMSREQILEAGALLNRFKIPQKVGNMIGLPGETVADMRETLELNMAIKPGLALATIFVPYPSLELTNYAVEHGYLAPAGLDTLPETYFKRTTLAYSETDQLTIRKLAWLFQIMVDHPALYRNKMLNRLLFALPPALVRLFFEVHYLYKFSRQYRVKSSLQQRVRVLWRHLKGALGMHRPDRN